MFIKLHTHAITGNSSASQGRQKQIQSGTAEK